MLQVAMMMAAQRGAGVEVVPLPSPVSQAPQGWRPATKFALDFQYCLERVRWQVREYRPRSVSSHLRRSSIMQSQSLSHALLPRLLPTGAPGTSLIATSPTLAGPQVNMKIGLLILAPY